jgi:hypothetical protein
MCLLEILNPRVLRCQRRATHPLLVFRNCIIRLLDLGGDASLKQFDMLTRMRAETG